MDNFFITAVSTVSETDLAGARLGQRFGRLDRLSQLALLAVESLGINFDTLSRDHVGICLAVRAGSLSTDVEYWKGRAADGGPSPTLFTYTLPSAAVGEIAIRHRLTGPNLCFVGPDAVVLDEAADWLRRGDVQGCVCVSCDMVSDVAAELIQAPPAACACALFLKQGGPGHALSQNDRDMKLVCAKVRL